VVNLIHIPQGSLAPYVKFIWCNEGYRPESIKERVLPAGSSQFIINLEDKRFCHFKGVDTDDMHEFDRAVLVGVQTSSVFLDARTRISTMGVVFWPGGLQALFNLPTGELTNQVISVSDVTDRDITALRQELSAESNPDKKFCLLKSFLISILDLGFQPNPAIMFSARKVYNQNGKQPISEITDQVGYSRRRLSELFRDTVGASPKQYSRIQRFQYSLKMLRSEPNLSNIALECGYYDQAHFNRDFKALSGITPTEYLEKNTGELNHLPA
jgi:AraC-like DNA-binding protein